MLRAGAADIASIKVSKGSYLCHTCNVVMTLGSKKSHEQGKKHKALSKIQNKRVSDASKTIHVSRLPSGVLDMEISDYFSQFGFVSRVHLNMERVPYAFVEFSTPDVIPHILKVNHRIRGKSLAVNMTRVRPVSNQNKTVSQPDVDMTHGKKVVDNIQIDVSFDEQVNMFVKNICLSPDEVSRRQELVSTLSYRFQEFFPESFLQVFGSSANGLGFTGCDIDISFFLPYQRDEDSLLELPRNDIPSVESVRSGRVPRHFLTELCKTNLLQFLCKVLRATPGFKFPQFIPSLRCPLVKAHCYESRIHCDISYNKGLGVANTRLLRLYGQMDIRIYNLLLILRYWGKKEELIGSNQKMSSYAFSWLVIFFLQKKHFAPTLETLALLAERKSEAEDWDCSFCENLSIIPRVTKTDTIAELLMGFFQFYSTFDFTAYVICPRDGTCVLKSELIAQAEDLDFKISTMSVQDVFDLTHNITFAVTDAVLRKFLLLSSDIYQVLQQELGKEGVNLKMLFEVVPRNPLPVKIQNIVIKQKNVQPSQTRDLSQSIQNNVKDEQSLNATSDAVQENSAPTEDQKIQKSLLSDTVEVKFINLMKEVGDRYDVLCRLFMDIFKRAFLFDCISMYCIESNMKHKASFEESAQKKQKLGCAGETADIYLQPNKDTLLLHVLCKAYHRTWVGRKVTKQNFILTGENRMANEEALARAQVKGAPTPKNPLHEFEAVLVSSAEPVTLTLRLIPRNKTKELNNCLLPFLQRYINVLSLLCIDYYLKTEKLIK